MLNQLVSQSSVVNRIVNNKAYANAFEWHLVEWTYDGEYQSDALSVTQYGVVRTDEQSLSNGLMPTLAGEMGVDVPVFSMGTYGSKSLAENAMMYHSDNELN